MNAFSCKWILLGNVKAITLKTKKRKKMKALVYEGPEKINVREVPLKEIKSGEARIKVTYCGVCGSDIGIFSGKHPRAKAPLIMGHEFVGTIEDINGDTKGLKVGDRVVPFPLISCGTCYGCRTGNSHVCDTLKLIGIDMDGGMAEYVNCNTDVLFKIPDEVSDKVAALIEPLAVGVHAIHRSGFKPLDTVAIMGAGPIGVLIGIVLKNAGASKIVISDISQPRLDLCKRLGFETVNETEEPLYEYVSRETKGECVNIVYECTGVSQAAADMTKVICTDGMVCLVGVHKSPREMNLGDMHYRELNMTATRVYTKEEFKDTVEYIEKIKDDLELLVTHKVDLCNSEKIFDIIADPKENAMKVVINCREK